VNESIAVDPDHDQSIESAQRVVYIHVNEQKTRCVLNGRSAV
jgi:hypothetical protein